MPNKRWEIRSNAHTEYDNLPARYLKLTIEEVVNIANNSSTLNWTLASVNQSGHYYTTAETTVKINGTAVYYKARTAGSSHTFPAALGSTSGSVTIQHDANGYKRDVPIVFKTRVWYSTYDTYDDLPNWATESGHCYVDNGSGTFVNLDINGVIDLTPIPVYTLSIQQGANSSISVNRTASGAGSLGTLSNGARLYYDDYLMITFGASSNYEISTHTVNGTTFPSGNTHIVRDDVSVVSSATGSLSTASATDAYLNTVSTIVVNRHSDTYYHSLRVNTNNDWTNADYISESGELTSVRQRYQKEVIAFRIPSSMSSLISQNQSSTTLTLRCYTYTSVSAGSALGYTEFPLTISINPDTALPRVYGTVVDTYGLTTQLTGDNTKLVKYRSKAECTISGNGQQGATIVERKINGEDAVEHSSTYSLEFANVEGESFTFYVKDSRGNSNQTTIMPTIIQYKKLTLNASAKRGFYNSSWSESPVGDRMQLGISGTAFSGSFGREVNSITAASYTIYDNTSGGSAYTTGQITGITINANNRYSKSIILGTPVKPLLYEHEYRIHIVVEDELMHCETDVVMPAGLPIFDWGKTDFNINGDLKLNGTNILDIIYPVGSVYFNVNSTMPNIIADHGTWVSQSTGITGVNSWKRTS